MVLRAACSKISMIFNKRNKKNSMGGRQCRRKLFFILCFLFAAPILPWSGISDFIVEKAQADPGSCAPLDPQDYPCDITVTTAAELQSEIANSDGNETICLADNTYQIANLWLWDSNVTLRSASGNRDAVIIDGNYTQSQSIFNIRAAYITIADMTIQKAWYHPIHIAGGGDNALLHNLHIIDGRQQLIKVNTNGQLRNDYGTLQCSTLEMTDSGRQMILNNPTPNHPCYLNGFDVINGSGWIIRDNLIEGMYCQLGSDMAGPAILAWGGSENTVVERNKVIDSDMGIFLGLSSPHYGGVVRNNFVKGHAGSDVGIAAWHAPNAKIVNNTVYSPGGWAYSIEARFSDSTDVLIQNNLTDETIYHDRQGASSTLVSNYQYSNASNIFVYPEDGDLHLKTGNLTGITDAGTNHNDRADDIDQEVIVDGQPDIGADEQACTPSCMDKQCGDDDGCGGGCVVQTCSDGQTCNMSGQCEDQAASPGEGNGNSTGDSEADSGGCFLISM